MTKENAIRRAIQYENEVATPFEFVMYYVKIWKIACQDFLTNNGQKIYDLVYLFVGEIESAIYDYTKSILIDADSSQYRSSIVVCALLSITIDIYLKLEYSMEAISAKAKLKHPRVYQHIQICCQIWDQMVVKIFGDNTVEMMKDFGKYLVMRQQRMFYLYRIHKVDAEVKLYNIYKERCKRFYNHDFFDDEIEKAASVRAEEAFTFESLQVKFSKTLKHINDLQNQNYAIETHNTWQKAIIDS